MAKILLHGSLHVTIFEAQEISNSSRPSSQAPGFLRKLAETIEDTVGVGKDSSKIYATIGLDKARVGRTRTLTDETASPRWYESFHVYCAHLASDVVFTIRAKSTIGASTVGVGYLPVRDIFGGQEVDRWLPLCDDDDDKDRKPLEGGSKVHVKLQYFDISKDHSWGHGVRSGKYPGVPYTFFSQRQGCKVTLYQDAHVPDGFFPRIPLDGGRCYEPHRCWEDIFDAISSAKHLIYITGWSVYTEITLVRDGSRPKPGGGVTLGGLLKKKAGEGVRVLMLIWDDRTSVGVLKKDGLMATHDEETMNYFQGTDVHCVLCPRNPDDSGSIVQDLQISTMFTHHQKIVVVDHDMPATPGRMKRLIVSFVGGLDLCDGRYDTPVHSLFGTLGTVHHDDFHQPNFATAAIAKGGPREPWHDIHCRLEGPVAWDVSTTSSSAGASRVARTSSSSSGTSPTRSSRRRPSRSRRTARRGTCSCSGPSTAEPRSGSRTPPTTPPGPGSSAARTRSSTEASRTPTSTPSGAPGASSTSRTSTSWAAPTAGSPTASGPRTSARCTSSPRSCP